MTTVLARARSYVGGGLSVIPIADDGSKAPAIGSWSPYQDRQPTDAELARWFRTGRYGIAAVCGPVSGHLELLDVDDPALVRPFLSKVEETCLGLLRRLVLIQTPRPGLHIPYRCEAAAGVGNLKLARGLRLHPETAEPKKKTLIETRGRGGYFLTVGSPAACHPMGRTYRLLRGDLAAVPTISAAEREALHLAARAFHELAEMAPVEHPKTQTSERRGDRPGDHYAGRMTWRQILEPHGWRLVRTRGETGDWRRRGKGLGISATTHHSDADTLYAFSSNADPFEDGESYGKFAAYCLLNHAGDYHAAAKALAAQGYGARALELDLGEEIVKPDGSRVVRLPSYERPCGVLLASLRGGAA